MVSITRKIIFSSKKEQKYDLVFFYKNEDNMKKCKQFNMLEKRLQDILIMRLFRNLTLRKISDLTNKNDGSGIFTDKTMSYERIRQLEETAIYQLIKSLILKKRSKTK